MYKSFAAALLAGVFMAPGACLAAEPALKVVSIPGPSSVVTALSAAGLPSDVAAYLLSERSHYLRDRTIPRAPHVEE